MLDSIKGVFRTQSSFYDGVLFAKIVNDRKPLTNFATAFETLFAKCLEVCFTRCLREMFYVALDKMLLKQLCKISSRFANPTFLRLLKCILQRYFQGFFYHCLGNHLAKMSKNCLCKMSYNHYMRWILYRYARYLLDLQIRHLLGVSKTSCRDVLSVFIRHF